MSAEADRERKNSYQKCKSGKSLRRYKQAAGKSSRGICLCGKKQRGKIFADKWPDEPQGAGADKLEAGKNADN